MSQQLDALNAAVAANSAAVAAVVAEVASLKAAGVDPAALQAAADQVLKNNADLSAALPAA